MSAMDRDEVARRFARVREATESLVAGLAAEDQVVQSMPDVSPTKWHRAHTTWFFETFVLFPFGDGYTPFDPRFGYLFNSYYEAVGPHHARPQRGLLSRPTVAEVADYRRHVDAAVRQFVETVSSARWPQAAARIELGLHHEQQHQELILMDIKHVFSRHPFPPAFRPRRDVAAVAGPPLRWFEHEGGLFEIGHEGDEFAFDNEGPRHKVWLRPFRLASRPVTAGEVIEFIADDGYRRPELWLSDGWALCLQERWDAPLYWRREGDRWCHFTLHGVEPIDPAAPACHLSYYEADAIAAWAGKRLPTEAEWEVVARELPVEGHLFDGENLHPRASADAVDSPVALYGDVWEWTRSPYAPYPGYRPPAGPTSEYNGKFMSSQMVLRGGCIGTPPDHIRATYRNFFYPHMRWQFGGARLAEDAE